MLIINNFAILSTLTDYQSDSDAKMSETGTTIVADNTNPFAGDIVIGDKVGNSLFNKSIEGLLDDQ